MRKPYPDSLLVSQTRLQLPESSPNQYGISKFGRRGRLRIEVRQGRKIHVQRKLYRPLAFSHEFRKTPSPVQCQVL